MAVIAALKKKRVAKQDGKNNTGPGYMAQIWQIAQMKEDTDIDYSSEHAQEEDAVEEFVTGYHSLGYMFLLGF